MSNPYFNKTPLQVVTGTTARATDLNNTTAATELAFDNLLTGGLQVRSANYAVATGSANAYAVTLTPVPAAYAAGMEVIFKANHTNTGAATLNVNSLSPISIKMPNGDAMAAGDIPSGGIIRCWYDGTNFQISGDYSAAVAADALLAAGYAAAAENAKNAAVIAQAAAEAAAALIIPFRGVLCTNSTTTSIADSTLTTVAFDTELYDTTALHSTSVNPERITIPAGISKVRLRTGASLAPFAGAGVFAMIISPSFSGWPPFQASVYVTTGDLAVNQVETPVINVSPGDYFVCKTNHTTGGAATLSDRWFSLEVVE